MGIDNLVGEKLVSGAEMLVMSSNNWSIQSVAKKGKEKWVKDKSFFFFG